MMSTYQDERENPWVAAGVAQRRAQVAAEAAAQAARERGTQGTDLGMPCGATDARRRAMSEREDPKVAAERATDEAQARKRSLPWNQAQCVWCGSRLTRLDSVSLWESEESSIICPAAPPEATRTIYGSAPHNAAPVAPMGRS